MIDLPAELDKLIASPYRDVLISTPYTGLVKFCRSVPGDREIAQTLKNGVSVSGPMGQWSERPGTALFEIERQGAKEFVHAPINGIVKEVNSSIDGTYVEAFTPVLIIQHPLTMEEAIEEILKKVLIIFEAPEDTSYILNAKQASFIRPPAHVVTMSYMKRDVPLIYTGEAGILYAVYFSDGQRVKKGNPLLGICPEERLDEITRMKEVLNQKWRTS